MYLLREGWFYYSYYSYGRHDGFKSEKKFITQVELYSDTIKKTSRIKECICMCSRIEYYLI